MLVGLMRKRLARFDQGDALWVVVVLGAEEPAWAFADNVVSGEHKLGEKLVGVDLVSCVSSVVTTEFVFVVIVKPVAVADWAVLWHPVGLEFFAFVDYNEFCLACALPRFADIPPEAGMLDEVASSVEKVATGFIGNFRLTLLDGASSHVWRTVDGSEIVVATRVGAGVEKGDYGRGGDKKKEDASHVGDHW